MPRNNTVLITAAVLLAFAAGLLLGRSIDRGDGEMRDSAGNSLVAPATRNADGDQRRPFQNLRPADAPRAAAEAEGFAFDRLVLDTNGDAPRACLQFNAPLNETGDVNYGDYVRLTPAVKPAALVAGSSLCLEGLEFNKEYSAQLRSAFPNAKGETLGRGDTVTIAFGDKPAYVGFAGDGVILPRLDADGVGIETVNVERFAIAVYRVSDRTIFQKSVTSGEAVGEDEYAYVYGENDGEDVGVKIFETELAVEEAPNANVSTVFPLAAALPNLQPGAYFVKLRDISPGADEYRTAQSWRWLMLTDMALTTYSSSEGVDVIVRSIATARPLPAVELVMLAQNNDILARATTTADGRASFAKAAISGDYPLSPKIITAYGPQQDFASIDLTRSPLDLSDLDVGGRGAPPVVDAYLYTERGIYRPGEIVHLTGILRGADGTADTRGVNVTIRKPNGLEASKSRIATPEIGGFAVSYELPDSAPRGVWSVEVTADGAGVAGTETFSVEDFVPQRLEVALDMDETTPLKAGEAREVGVESRYLYGAAASGLVVEGEARLRLDPNPFPDYPGYRYGPVESRFSERFIALENGVTDGGGRATLSLAVNDAPKNFGAPLRADLVVGVVEPGGRTVRESARIPMRPDARYLGLKLAGDGGGFARNTPAEISALLLDRLGEPVTAEIEWRLVEEEYWFDWYRQDGRWQWRRSYKDILVGEGRATTGAEGGAKIEQPLDVGTYRLTAVDPSSGAKSDIRFYVGWRSYESGADSPDQATLTLESQNITPGARARLFLDPPYAGEAIVVIATEKVQLVQRMKVDDAGREIIIDTDPSWGSGFYVMATVVTPRDAVDRPIPRRAMGVAYVPFDMGAKKLNVALDTPQMIRPRQQISIPVKVDGLVRGEDAMLTVAAVDEGVLRLTKFESPDPVEYFFSKKALDVAVRDDYGRILDPNLGAAMRFGGDQIGGEGLTVVPTKTIAMYRGPLRLNDDGEAIVTLDIPDFNGELRLMAVAWSAAKLGATAKPLTVRDRVPALLALPRFLAPGDQASATLLIDNVEGAPGGYEAALSATGPILANVDRNVTLAAGQKETLALPIEAEGAGVASIALNVEGPDDFDIRHTYDLQVRSPHYPVTEISTRRLASGESVSLSAALTEPFLTGSAVVTASFSPISGVDPGALLESLYRYPYGCSEQLTSSAMPLLFVDTLGQAVGRGPDYEIRPRVQRAVNSLLDRQSPDGAFGLWREGDSGATGWLGAYITDFLFRAKAEGYGVSQPALDKAYDALAKIADVERWSYVSYQTRAMEGPWSNDTTDQLKRRSAAYALYVLARAGRADLSDLRYFHDSLLDSVSSPLARAHIGAALAMMGDRARALSAFEKAREALGYQNTGDYYQSSLRDAAGVLALLTEIQGAPGVESVLEAFSTEMKEPNAMHTQEKAYVLLAAQSMLKSAGETRVSRNGAALADLGPAPRFAIGQSELSDGVTFQNDGDGPVFSTVSVYGAPAKAPDPVNSGVELTKRLLTRDGKPIDVAAIKQNDRFVIVISGKPGDNRLHPMIIADLLPAGFEIETVLGPEDGAGRDNDGPYRWIGEISRPKIAEARDDRFVAAIDVREARFTLAYVVRAVSPGVFAFPGAVAEDMYRPGVFGRTAAGRVSIAAAN